ncbi:VWA domain-containing protein [Streptomyces sp. NPDC091292]|uniref:vWA domain-containing protein n=1 Tax=Streptomyces sp. NPDC091292 TaxID=3365991 RepID=UPI003805A58F
MGGRPGGGRAGGRVRRAGGGAVLVGAVLCGLVVAPLPEASAAPAESIANSGNTGSSGDTGSSGLVMVLDSSGSMADDDGTGRTRMESARDAVGTVVDSLPDGYPTGLRVYGADQPRGCTDTRLVRPVEALDREAMKRAVGAVRPKGDTPIGLSLRKAAQDLPEPRAGAIGRRTILLISDGEDNCGAPEPCEVARELGEDGVDLRIDTIGFQVKGAARKQLECVADAGHGSYYDAPDAEALARQLVRASQLSADGYRFRGASITGGSRAEDAAGLTPGQYLDTIGPGETRWYAASLDGASAADFGVTAVPQPGVRVAYGDGIELKLTSTGRVGATCDSDRAHFSQTEGAMVLTSAVSRIPSSQGNRFCDKAGRFLLSVHRSTASGSDAARWPVELRLGTEKPLKAGTVPAESATEYGAAGPDAVLPVGDPKDVTGGTGFNDARALTKGVWRDHLLPAQTRWYKVRVGWGQQLRYRLDFGNEPTVDATTTGTPKSSFVHTAVYTQGRKSVWSGTGFRDRRGYYGDPAALDMGTVPVSWTNRWEPAHQVVPLRAAGDYYVAVSLGPEVAAFAENPAIGVVLKVDVVGDELAGPQHDAPPRAKNADDAGDTAGTDGKGGAGDSGARADGAESGAAGWSTVTVASVAGGAVALIAALGLVFARRRAARAAAGTGTAGWTTRGGA